MSDGIVYAGPEGIITATSDGYTVEDDGGPVEGTFKTLVDAHAAIGSTPPQYPDAGPGEVVSEPVVVILQECPDCHGEFEDLRAHRGATSTRDKCPVKYGPADDFSDVAARARAARERA